MSRYLPRISGHVPGGRASVRDASRFAARQVRGRHRIRVIRVLLTVEMLAWHRGDCGPSHDREPEWITQLALVRAMADVMQERVDEAAADLAVAETLETAPPHRRRHPQWRSRRPSGVIRGGVLAVGLYRSHGCAGADIGTEGGVYRRKVAEAFPRVQGVSSSSSGRCLDCLGAGPLMLATRSRTPRPSRSLHSRGGRPSARWRPGRAAPST
jgi:hypothetical protein